MEVVGAPFALIIVAAYLALIIYLVVLATRFVRAVERIADKFDRSQ